MAEVGGGREFVAAEDLKPGTLLVTEEPIIQWQLSGLPAKPPCGKKEGTEGRLRPLHTLSLTHTFCWCCCCCLPLFTARTSGNNKQ
jgi:hypothetical protein